MINSCKLLSKKYPQNYILRNPLTGSLIWLAFIFCFMIIYEPLKSPYPHILPYAETMALYCLGAAGTGFVLIKLLNSINYFSEENWTFVKELISIAIVIFGEIIVVYLMGFLLEPPASRWNLPTFLNSIRDVFLIGIIPWAFSILFNYRHLFVAEILQDFESAAAPASPQEELIQIGSRLKKEELSFYPGQFIYAESEGNYVNFYLNLDNRLRKEVIRNSISDIEQQLSKYPFIIRVHRAFIVNVNKVLSKKGSTLGYRLKLSCTDEEIPVSRQNTSIFDKLLKDYKVSVHHKKLPPVTIPGSIS